MFHWDQTPNGVVEDVDTVSWGTLTDNIVDKSTIDPTTGARIAKTAPDGTPYAFDDGSAIIVRHGDTGQTPLSSGTVGARGASYTIAAIAEAATALKGKMARYLIHDRALEGADAE